MIGDDDFAGPPCRPSSTPCRRRNLGLVGYVRGLHGMRWSLKLRAEERAGCGAPTAEGNFDQATKTYGRREASQRRAVKNVDVDDAVYAKEMAAMGQAKKELDAAQAALNYFSTRPGKGTSVPRPDLTVKPDQVAKMVELGQRLYENKYGCNGCHSLGADGGKVGPALDRAGFRLNGTWIYRWLKNPHAISRKPGCRRSGLSDADAKAVTMYLGTLRAPKPDAHRQAGELNSSRIPQPFHEGPRLLPTHVLNMWKAVGAVMACLSCSFASDTQLQWQRALCSRSSRSGRASPRVPGAAASRRRPCRRRSTSTTDNNAEYFTADLNDRPPII